MTRVQSLTAIFDHLRDTGLVDDDAWRRLRAHAQSRAVEWPVQGPDEQAAAWARGSLPDHEYRSARLHLDVKDALNSDAGAAAGALEVFGDIDGDLRARVEVYEGEQVAAVRAAFDQLDG